MRERSARLPKPLLLGAVVLVLAGCSGATRVATINETAHISGAAAATMVQQQLAKHGYSNATVSCARSIIVNVGPAVACKLSGAGAHTGVRFTFRTLDGKIDVSSVRVSG